MYEVENRHVMKHLVKYAAKILPVLLLIAVMLASCSLDSLLSVWEEEALPCKLAVHFLDVGQGDAIFTELPNGETMLIDAGENYYGDGIIRYIENTGHHKIDYLVATHPHADHIGSMPYIVRHFDIGTVYMPKVTANTKLFESLIKAFKSKKLRVKNGRAGVTVVSGSGFAAEIIAPSKIDANHLNNCSVIIRLTYGSTSFLLTGDAETGETNAIDPELLRADVLKAGHHGGKDAVTQKLLQAVRPSVTVISCGKNNDYGHPHKEVLSALKHVGSTVYRTDKDKTVIVTSNGSDVTVSTGNPAIKREI